MADQLSINIDVSQAKAALDQLRQSFAAFKTSAEQSVTGASSAVQKLNTAMASLKGINPAATESLTRLQQAMNSLSGGSNLAGLATSLRDIAAIDIGRVGQQLQALSASLNQIKVPPALGQLVQGFQRVGTAAQSASQQVSGASGGFNTFGSNAQRAGQGVNQFGGVLGTTRNLIGGFGVALGAVGFSQFITGSFDAMKSVNGFTAAMTGVTGSSKEASELLKYTGEVSQKLAIDIGAAREGFKNYAASALTSGQSMDDVKQTFEGVSTAARVLNLSSSDTMGVFRALGQIASKGTVQMEELRGQIGDRMPGAVDAMARAVGVGKDQLFEMVKAGEVGSDILPKFGAELQKMFGAGLPAALNTAEAAFTRFQNSLQNAMASFGKGFFAPLTDAFSTLSKSFDSTDGMQKLGQTLGELSAGIIQGFVAALDVLRSFTDVIGNVASGVGDLLTSLGLVPAATGAVASSATNTVTPMEALGVALGVAALAGVGMMTISALSGILTGVAAAARVASAALLVLARNPLALAASLVVVGGSLMLFGDKLGELSASTNKTDSALSNAKTAVETFGGSTDELKDKMAAVKEQAGEFATSQEKLAKGFETASTAATKLPGPMGQLQAVVGTLNEPLGNVAKSLGTVGLMFESMQTSIPVAKDALNEFAGIVPVVDEVIKPLPVTLAATADALAKIVRDMPAVTGQLEQLGGMAAVASEPLSTLAAAMRGIASTADGTKKSQEAFAAFIAGINDSKVSIESATENLSKLGGAAYGIEGGFKKAIEGGEKFVGALDNVNSGVDATIAKMDELRKAAENAFKAAQTASGSGGGGSADIAAQREGGYAGDRLASQMVSLDAFKSAPAFAEGTANTSKYLSRVSGGGIPSILHPNEAVVPLSRGRSIPVDLSMAMQGQASATDVDLSPLSKMADAIGDLAASLTMPAITVDVMAPAAMDMPALLPPQSRNTDGLGPSGAGTEQRSDSRRDSGSGGDKRGNTFGDIHVHIQAQDVESFGRSKDQIRRQLGADIAKANRRARS